MKLSIAAALLFGLSLISAQIAGEPQCAAACLSSAVVQIGCALNDVGCQCAPAAQASLAMVAAPCLIASCPAASLVAIQSIGIADCLSYSAMLTAALGEPTSLLTSVPPTAPATSESSFLTSVPPTAPATSARSGSSTISTISTASSGSSSLPPAASPSDANGGSLSTGAKIGIGVGVPLAVIILAILAFFIYRRRRQAKDFKAEARAVEYPGESKSELPESTPSNLLQGELFNKVELEGTRPNVQVVELEHRLASGRQAPPPPPTELGVEPVAELSPSGPAHYPVSPIPVRAVNPESGPLQFPAELLPVASSPNEPEFDEDDLAYKERQLQERRAILAERERLAAEEGELRNQRARLKAFKSNPRNE